MIYHHILNLILFSILSIIVIVSSSVILLNMRDNADGVCKYCIYVSVWSSDMVEAKFVPIFAKSLLNVFGYFFSGLVIFYLLSTIYVGNLL